MRNAGASTARNRRIDSARRGPEPESSPLNNFMTVEDVAEMLRINKSTVYRMAKQGRLPATRVGRQWRFRLSALEEFLDSGGEAVFEEERRQAQGGSRW